MSAKKMEDIAAVFEGLRFRKKLFGGVDERDVWKQLEKLQSEYRAAYEGQQQRYLALIQERENTIQSLRQRLAGTGQESSNRNPWQQYGGAEPENSTRNLRQQYGGAEPGNDARNLRQQYGGVEPGNDARNLWQQYGEAEQDG